LNTKWIATVAKYKQGKFKCSNPQKYKGNPTNIEYRSGWELTVMQYLDKHQDVIQWSSEEVIIPYVSPIDNRKHRYFMDFWVHKRNRDGTIETCLIEVKPKKQTIPPKAHTKGKPSKSFLNEVKTWGVNQAKWAAARIYCASRGWKFYIFNEDDINVIGKFN
jgi:hypothetical protein